MHSGLIRWLEKWKNANIGFMPIKYSVGFVQTYYEHF